MDKSETMTPLDRKYALEKAGYTQTRFANEHGVNSMSINHLIQGKMVSYRLMLAFAKTIGKDHRLVFPEYFLDPNRRKRKTNNKTT